MLKHIVKNILNRLGYDIHRFENLPFFHSLLSSYIRRKGKLSFIQIGANDGISSDPLYRFIKRNKVKVKGIVVEPLPDFFAKLKKNYSGFPEITAVNKAIHNSKGEMKIYRVNPARLNELPAWAGGIASFDPGHHRRSAIPADVIIEEKVECITLAELTEKYNCPAPDLLQIDTEGYDAEIILNINFERMKPAVIHFEHNLNEGVMDKETFQKVTTCLHENGYEIWLDDNDATAYQRNIFVEMCDK